MIYPLHGQTKGNYLTASSSSYSEEYAQRMCDLYLKEEVTENEKGHMQKYYRLHAKHEHTPEMALAYDIQCPDCYRTLKQVGRQISFNKLGLYTCPACNR